MRYAPAQRDVEIEKLRQFGGGAAGVRVAPGAERHQNTTFGAESHIAVHHCAYTYCGQALDVDTVVAAYVRAQIGITSLHAVDYIVDAIGPQSVDKAVFPIVHTLCDGGVCGTVGEHGFDACRAELYAQHRAAVGDDVFQIGVHDIGLLIKRAVQHVVNLAQTQVLLEVFDSGVFVDMHHFDSGHFGIIFPVFGCQDV